MPIEFDQNYATIYDHKIRKLIPGYLLLHELSRHTLQALLPVQAKIVVAGAGTGQEVIETATANPGWQYCLVEPSAPMREEAQRRAEAAGIAQRVSFRAGRVGLDAELESAPCFDAALSLLVLHFVAGEAAKLAYLRQLAGCLHPGAPLLLADMEGERDSAVFAQQIAIWHRQQLASRSHPETVALDFSKLETDIYPLPAPRLHALLDEAGFTPPIAYFRAWQIAGYYCHRR